MSSLNTQCRWWIPRCPAFLPIKLNVLQLPRLELGKQSTHLVHTHLAQRFWRWGVHVCIKALPPVTGTAIDLVVWLHWAMILRPKLPILLNPHPLVVRYPNWSLLPSRQLRALYGEAVGILQTLGSSIQRWAAVTQCGGWENLYP